MRARARARGRGSGLVDTETRKGIFLDGFFPVRFSIHIGIISILLNLYH